MERRGLGTLQQFSQIHFQIKVAGIGAERFFRRPATHPVFFEIAHNPTELNYQGPDHGTQYRSAVFPVNAEQRSVAQAYIAQLDKAHVFSQPVVTHVEEFKGFYPAENYHQNYLVLHPDAPYIAINDLPKVSDLKRMFPDLYRNDPVLLKVAGS